MHDVSITIASDLCFVARFERDRATATCSAFEAALPFTSRLVQARWSGESAWVPLGDLNLGIGPENATSHPSRGDLLLYPASASQTEILFPYGSCMFSSKVGQLAGNHFLTLISGQAQLAEMGRRVLWEGAQDIVIEL